MRHMRVILWGCLALLPFPLAAAEPPGPAAVPPTVPSPASFDCARADKAAEKLICADPDLAALDRQIGDLYRTAVTRAGNHAATLKGEQRRWLGYRDGLGEEMERSAGPLSPETVRDELREALTLRRDQLARLANKPFTPDVDALCERAADIVNAIPHDAPALQNPLMSQMQAAGLVTISQPSQEISAKWKRALHLDPDMWTEGAGIVRFGPQGEFVGPYATEGTANCTYFDIYKADGHGGYTAVPDPLPDGVGGGMYCDNMQAMLGTIADRPALITEIIDTPHDRWFFRLADRTGKEDPWGASCTITIDYATAYRLDSPDSIGCADAAVCQAVRDTATAWADGVATWDERDDSPYPRLNNLTPPDKAATPPRMVGEGVPQVNGFQWLGRLSNFTDEAPYRLWHSPVGPLLVLVSKAHLGWRRSNDVLIGVWRQDGKTLRPVAGAEVIDTRLSIKKLHRVSTGPDIPPPDYD